MDLGYTNDWDDDDGFDFGDYYDSDYCSSDHPINKSVKYENVPSEINQDSTKVSRRSGGFGSPSTLKTNEKLNLTAGLGRGKSGGFGGKNTRSKFQSKKELESQGKKNKENGKFLFSRSNYKIKTIHLEEEKNHKLAEDFRAAIANGNIDAVKTVLTQGLSVDSLLKSSWTGLMYAANNGLPDVVALLIERGANVNYQKDMFTVVMAACSSDCEAEDEVAECLKILIEKGAKINSRDRYHMTPLMYTCRNGREKLVEILLQQKPDINKQDQRGWTALCWAASRGHGRIARMLIDNNANLTLYTNDGQSAEDLAYEGGFTTLADVLNNLVHPNRFIDQNIRGNEVCDTSGQRDCVRFGDLEMFLFGLELGHLIPLLQEHKINFEGLLQLTDSELQQLGVSQVGVRKKILSATHDVHTKEWDLSLLPSQTLDHVKSKDLHLVLANVAKHLQYIKCSVGYVIKSLKQSTNPNSIVQDGEIARQFVQRAEDISAEVSGLSDELTRFRNSITELSASVPNFPADLVSKESMSVENNKKTLYLPILLVSGCVVLGISVVCRLRDK